MRRQVTTVLLLASLASFAQVLLLPGHAMAMQRSESDYLCPMHAGVKSKRPGNCPKCGMTLRAADGGAGGSGLDAESSAPSNGESSLSLRIPDTAVQDQDGRRLSFFTDLIKGRTVAINFIFTTCTTICPPLTATFRRVQQELGQRVGRDITLISVSVDPATDIPERLKAHAVKFNAGPGWMFVTGTKPEIDALLRRLGGYNADKNDHTPIILVGNERAGYWTRTYGLAPAATIVKAIDEAARKGSAAGPNQIK